MKANLKVILSAVGVVALLASPAVAESHARHHHASHATVLVPSDAYNQTPTFDNCFALSVERGSGPNKGGGTKEDSQNKAFIAQCMAGKIPLR